MKLKLLFTAPETVNDELNIKGLMKVLIALN